MVDFCRTGKSTLAKNSPTRTRPDDEERDRPSKQKSLLRAALSGRMEGRIAALRSGSHLRAWSRRQLGGWREVERDLPVTQRAWLPMQANLPMSSNRAAALVTDGVAVRGHTCVRVCHTQGVSSSRGRVDDKRVSPKRARLSSWESRRVVEGHRGSMFCGWTSIGMSSFESDEVVVWSWSTLD